MWYGRKQSGKDDVENIMYTAYNDPYIFSNYIAPSNYYYSEKIE